MRGVPRAAAMLQCFHATSHCHHVWYDNPHLTQHTQASEPSTRTPHARRNSILARAAHTPARPRTMSLVLLHSAPAAGAVAGLRRRRGGAAVVRAASTSPLDRLQGASTLESVLNLADDELQELCSMRGTPEQQAECWEVWKSFHDKRVKAQSGCELEQQAQQGAQDGTTASTSACAQLERLEKLVYDVACSGDAEQLYHVLKTQSNLEKRARCVAEGGDAAACASADARRQELLDAQRSKALDLFAKADVDRNGVIDREEFLGAMKLLQHALNDDEMQLALDAMDSHGYLTPEQFVSIVRAEQECDTAADAEMLRHVPHSRPKWWSDAPHCVTDV